VLLEIREKVQEDKKTVNKHGDKPVLDKGDSKRVPNSVNNGDKLDEAAIAD